MFTEDVQINHEGYKDPMHGFDILTLLFDTKQHNVKSNDGS